MVNTPTRRDTVLTPPRSQDWALYNSGLSNAALQWMAIQHVKISESFRRLSQPGEGAGGLLTHCWGLLVGRASRALTRLHSNPNSAHVYVHMYLHNVRVPAVLPYPSPFMLSRPGGPLPAVAAWGQPQLGGASQQQQQQREDTWLEQHLGMGSFDAFEASMLQVNNPV
jgi:hypothetical protein